MSCLISFQWWPGGRVLLEQAQAAATVAQARSGSVSKQTCLFCCHQPCSNTPVH